MNDEVRSPIRDTDTRASERRLRALLACTKGIVFEFDRDARYLGAWTHDPGLLARPLRDLLGRTINEILGENGQQFSDSVRRVFDTGEPEALDYELDVQGGHRWFTADVVLAPDTDGDGRTVVFLVRDVTEQKRLEDRLRTRLMQDAIGHVATGIAHDLNNLLTSIVGYADLLTSSHELSPRDRKHLVRVNDAAMRAVDLARRIQVYGRARVFSPEPLDVNAVITSLAERLIKRVGQQIELTFVCEPGLGLVLADRSGVEQIITNLVMNARDAINDTGAIQVVTSTLDLDDHGVAFGRYVIVEVSDDGCGMPPDIQERIFEHFFTTKVASQASGLGLPVVRDIVQQYGGYIDVETKPGEGSTFRVQIPQITP